MSKPRILYLITQGELGGAQVHVKLLLEHFKNEFEIKVCCGTESYLAEQAKILDVPFEVIPGLGKNMLSLKDMQAVAFLLKVIQQFQPNLISCHSTKAGGIGRIAAGIAKIPVIFTAHGWSFFGSFSRRVTIPFIQRILTQWTQKIICVSEYDRELAIKKKIAPHEKLLTIHNGMPELGEKFLAAPGIGEKVVLTMIGRFSVPKDHLLLLHALSNLRNLNVWELWLVGWGPEEHRLKQEAKRLQLENRVFFIAKKNEEIPETLAKSHIFVLISNWEGLPRSILEAMRAGLPVIATNVGGVPETVIDEQTGFLVPPKSVNELTSKLKILIENPELRVAMGGQGRKMFLKNFTIEKTIKKTKDVYIEIIESASSKKNASTSAG